jgi:hypothetical protein
MAAKKLRPGTHTLTAICPVSADHASAVSAGETLAVAR